MWDTVVIAEPWRENQRMQANETAGTLVNKLTHQHICDAGEWR
ncbi:MAG: hypothetical protein ACI8XU_001525, partial [Kiritimatiellia bacterium]